MTIGIIFWTGTGNTRYMAELIEQGAAAKGAKAELIEAADFTPDAIASYEAFAFGCPACGSEELNQDTFQPMWDAVEPTLAESGKPTVLFGSWGWGGGDYLDEWADQAKDAGVNVVATFSCEGDPDDEASAELVELGEKLVS